MNAKKLPRSSMCSKKELKQHQAANQSARVRAIIVPQFQPSASLRAHWESNVATLSSSAAALGYCLPSTATLEASAACPVQKNKKAKQRLIWGKTHTSPIIFKLQTLLSSSLNPLQQLLILINLTFHFHLHCSKWNSSESKVASRWFSLLSKVLIIWGKFVYWVHLIN